MTSRGSQPLRSKFLLISPSSSSNRTFLSAQMFLLRLSFSYVSWFFSLRNLSLPKVGEGEEVKVLLALVFLGMMLKIKRIEIKETEREEKKNQGQTVEKYRK